MMSSSEQEFQAATVAIVETATDDELLARRLELQVTQAAWSAMIVEANTGWINNLQEILVTDAAIAARGLVRTIRENPIPADLGGPEPFVPVILTLVEN